MTKTYITPELVPQGSVAELTKNVEELAGGDPTDASIYKLRPPGGVGFQL